MKRKSTRREFLEANAAALVGATLASAAAGRLQAASRRDKYRIFSEGRIAGMKLKNRFVRAATAEGSSPGGQMNRDGLLIYEQLARGGTGLIITGHIVAAHGGDAHEYQTHIDEDRFIDAATSIAETVHRYGRGCKVVAQLTHAGPGAIVDPVAASEMPARPSGKKPRALSEAVIDDLVAQFAASIRRARNAGFDGVELHGAHGYLLRTFLSPATNKRNDQYGGSAAARAEIIKRIVKAGRDIVGPDYPILLKLNCDDFGDNEASAAGFVEMVGEIEKTGVNGIEISGTNPVRTEIDSAERQSYFLPYAARLELKLPVILTGGNRSVEALETILQKSKVQFFGFARPLIREPDLPKRWQEGRGGNIAACISCNECLRALAKTPTHCVRV